MAHKLVFSPSLVLWQSDFDRQAQAEVKKESTPPEPAPPGAGAPARRRLLLLFQRLNQGLVGSLGARRLNQPCPFELAACERWH